MKQGNGMQVVPSMLMVSTPMSIVLYTAKKAAKTWAFLSIKYK